MGIFSTIGNLGLGDFDESKILDNDSGAAARRGAAEQKETKSPETSICGTPRGAGAMPVSWRKKHCLIRLMNARFVI